MYKSIKCKVTFSRKDFLIEKLLDHDLIRLKNGGLTNKVGWPALPFVVKYFVLPEQSKNLSVKLNEQKWVRLRGKYSIVPVQPPRPLAKNIEKDRFQSISQSVYWKRLEQLYGKNFYEKFYLILPKVAKLEQIELPWVEISSTSHYAGRVVVAIRIYPVRYNPAGRVVHYLSSAIVEIGYQMDKTIPQKSSTPPSSMALATDMKKLIALVENPEDIGFEIPEASIFPDIPLVSVKIPRFKPKKGSSNPVRKSYPWMRDSEMLIPRDTILISFFTWPYLIITDDFTWSEDGHRGRWAGNIISEFERLARWKTMKGWRARVVSVSDIMSNSFGEHWQAGITRDVQEAIRNFLKFAYKEWDTRWCLIGGDISIVPVRHILANPRGYKIDKKRDPAPEEGTLYYDSQNSVLRYHSRYDFTTDDVFFALGTSKVIRYNVNASTSQPGWHWTQQDYLTMSNTTTRYIVIHGPASILGQNFFIPDYSNMIPTDFYYASVDSPLYSQPDKHDWDSDGNYFYGFDSDGVDFFADISVGRAQAKDTSTARSFVDKVLTYERYRDVRTDPANLDYPPGNALAADYPRKLYCMAKDWGGGYGNGAYERIRWGDIDGACTDKEKIIEQFRDAGIHADHIKRFYEDDFFFPQIESNLWHNQTSIEVPELRRAVNEGPHFISITDHGLWFGMAGFGSSGATWVHPGGMTNWPHFAIYFVDSCNTNEFDRDLWKTYNRNGGEQAGNFDEVCFGKAVVQCEQGGAIAYIGFSRIVWMGHGLENLFWEPLSRRPENMQNHEFHLGKMLDHAHEIGRDRGVEIWNIFGLSLNGDPEMPLYTESPKVFTVSHCSHIYGKDEFTILVFHEEQPVTDPTLKICVSQISDTNTNDKVLFPLVSAGEGQYTFNTSGAKAGKVNVVVTAENYVPYIATVEKVSMPVCPSKLQTNGFIYGVGGMQNQSIIAASGNCLYSLSVALGLERTIPLVGTARCFLYKGEQNVLVGLGEREQSNPNLLLFDTAGNIVKRWSTPKKIKCIAMDLERKAVYAGLEEKGVYCYNSNGTQTPVWSNSDIGTCSFIGIDGDGYIYATGTAGGDKLRRLSPEDGSITWPNQEVYDIGGEPFTCLVKADGTAYISTRNRILHKVNSSGLRVWKNEALSNPVISIDSFGDMLYAGTGDGVVMEFDQDGNQRWTKDIGDRAECILVQEGGSRVYAGCWHGIYALDINSGDVIWFRETLGAILTLTQIGNILYGGGRDGWIYSIEI